MRSTDRRDSAAPEISEWLLAWFQRYAHGYLRRHLHAVRIARADPSLEGAPEGVGEEEPLVVYLNHPSWWDPLVCLLLARRLWPERRHYAPMDGEAMERYRLLGRLGFFPVERGTAAGVRRFLETSEALLARPGTALWLTPQGRFVDPRRRPVILEPGLAHLARRSPRAVFLPLALEYPFWEERTPEALARFGLPWRPDGVAGTDEVAGTRSVRVSDEVDEVGGTRSVRVSELSRRLAVRLEATQDALAADAQARDPGRFEVLLAGRAGVGGVYDLWRRLAARIRGEPFHAAHGGAARPRSPRPSSSGESR